MSRQICHAHCPQGGGKGWLIAAAVAVIVLAKPLANAAGDFLRDLAIATASLAAVAALTVAVVLVVRRRRRNAQVTGHVIRALSAPPAAIEAPRTRVPLITDLPVRAPARRDGSEDR